jgi:hypothetical protein
MEACIGNISRFCSCGNGAFADSVLGMLLAGSLSRGRKENEGEPVTGTVIEAVKKVSRVFKSSFIQKKAMGRQGSKYLSHRRSSKPKTLVEILSAFMPSAANKHPHMSLIVVSKNLANESPKNASVVK